MTIESITENKKQNTIAKLDLYHFGFNMLMLSFQNSNIRDGLKKSLFLAKLFTQSSDVLLYKKSKDDEYNFFSNGSVLPDNNRWLRILINQCKHTIESKKVFYFECEDISQDKDVVLIPFLNHERDYIVAIKNSKMEKLYENEQFLKIFNQTMNTILERIEQYDKMNRKGHKDDLTGLDNRNAYEEAIKMYSSSREPFVMVLFDLNRMKYVNDKYSYLLGDRYIIKTSEILKKYFPKYYEIRDKANSSDKPKTGSVVYRIGGDEFVLITSSLSIDEIERRVDMVKEEVKNIDLNVHEDLNLGICHGIATRFKGEPVKQVVLEAGARIKADKQDAYEKYSKLGIERRKN